MHHMHHATHSATFIVKIIGLHQPGNTCFDLLIFFCITVCTRDLIPCKMSSIHHLESCLAADDIPVHHECLAEMLGAGLSLFGYEDLDNFSKLATLVVDIRQNLVILHIIRQHIQREHICQYQDVCRMHGVFWLWWAWRLPWCCCSRAGLCCCHIGDSLRVHPPRGAGNVQLPPHHLQFVQTHCSRCHFIGPQLHKCIFAIGA
mmetsp:Transcript_28027/g.34019  ORF Transcript_28027/g.34019 Transcript_28027/m.34019 type:complete len:203 (+) Transcript_28027:704-1312(+)